MSENPRVPLAEWWRTKRFVETLIRANKRDGSRYPHTRAHRTIEALARLAR